MNPDEFPDIPNADDAQFISLDMAVLSKMIEKTVIIGGASDDKRAHITGLYVQNLPSDGTHIFRLVSTDGSRLSKVDHPFEKEPFLQPGKGVLIPKKGMYEVSKFLESEGSVEIGIKDNNFVVKKDGLTIIIRLLEGDFPEYEGILKKGQPHEITMDRQLFLMMLKRMSILSTEDYRSVIFKFDQDNLNITSTNPDIGESKEDMGITFSGDPIEVAFNPKYFIETLNVINEDNIVLYIENSEKPCMLEGESNKQFITVIMPMRI
jgi:DNA polymerase-3 subunit beta